MINYVELLNKKVRVITVVMYNNGRKIKTEYIGTVLSNKDNFIVIKESDLTYANIHKKFIKRIEEI
jgi:hypothetical protein